MKKIGMIGAFAAVAMLSTGAAMAAGFFTNGVPQAGGTQYPTTLPLTGNELLPADTQLPGGLNPQSEAISTLQLAGFGAGLPSGGNVLIGGDASTNLFQRGTTGSSVTTTATYGGPDRWVYWSGTNTAMTVSKDTTAGDLSSGFTAAFKMARTSGQTGVVQVCMAQEVETSNAIAFAGTTAELDFNAFTGANFSPASANVTAYIVTGTGTDEGVSKLAFGLNAGGGGASAWTGQANATAAVTSLGTVSTAGRYAAVATIPAGATELAVALCFTPVGTAGTNDYVAFEGIQLKRSTQLASFASASVGYNVATANLPASSFDRRQVGLEALYQYRYFWQLNETASVRPFMGQALTTTTANMQIFFPVTMRVAPTPAYTAGGWSATVAAGTTSGVCTSLAAVASTTTTNATTALCTVAAGLLAGNATQLLGSLTTGVLSASAEL